MEAAVLPAVIEEARRRQRRRSLLVVAIVALAAAGLTAYEVWPHSTDRSGGGAEHPRRHVLPASAPAHDGGTLTVVMGESDDSGKPAPFERPLRIFRRPRTNADTFAGYAFSAQAPAVGKPLLSQSRLVRSSPDPLYVVPTTTGAVCFAGADFSGCQRGLTRRGISFSFFNNGSGVDLTIVGVAANDVAAVDLVSRGLRRRPSLAGNVFVVVWPNGIGDVDAKRGRLIVHYDDRAPASVALG